MLPVSIVTGFLGSGKTTLIARLLRNPAFARTAVIVNEFGEIGLDHELIAASDEQLLTLSTGCLCCAVRADLLATLLDLQRRRAAGDIAYDRVLIETSGLADPAPILQALMTDRDVARHHAIDTLLTLVDAQHGEITLDRHPEARRQAALADRLLLSKTDVVGQADALRTRLAALNPGAPLFCAVAGDIAPEALFSGTDAAARVARLTTLADTPGWQRIAAPRDREPPSPAAPFAAASPAAPVPAASAAAAFPVASPAPPFPVASPAPPFPVASPAAPVPAGSSAAPAARSPAQPARFLAAAHSDGIATFSLVREAPLPALALTLWLEALVEHCGERLLRLKGLVDIAEMPGRPALIHGVRHVVSAPEWLDRWPSGDRRSRVVFIGEAIPPYFPARLLDAIEAEVVDETRRQTWN